MYPCSCPNKTVTFLVPPCGPFDLLIYLFRRVIPPSAVPKTSSHFYNLLLRQNEKRCGRRNENSEDRYDDHQVEKKYWKKNRKSPRKNDWRTSERVEVEFPNHVDGYVSINSRSNRQYFSFDRNASIYRYQTINSRWRFVDKSMQNGDISVLTNQSYSSKHVKIEIF